MVGLGGFHEKVIGLWIIITLNKVTCFLLFYIYLFKFFILADKEESLNSETFARTANEGSGKGAFNLYTYRT